MLIGNRTEYSNLLLEKISMLHGCSQLPANLRYVLLAGDEALLEGAGAVALLLQLAAQG